LTAAVSAAGSATAVPSADAADDAARSSLACALEVDPEGPIREIVAAELASLDTLARR
jgi:hypothetical protein